jgi:hypothetical protein
VLAVLALLLLQEITEQAHLLAWFPLQLLVVAVEPEAAVDLKMVVLAVVALVVVK